MQALILLSVAGLSLLGALHAGFTAPVSGAHWIGLGLSVLGIILGLWMSPNGQLMRFLMSSPAFIGAAFVSAAIYAVRGPGLIGLLIAAGGLITGAVSFLAAHPTPTEDAEDTPVQSG